MKFGLASGGLWLCVGFGVAFVFGLGVFDNKSGVNISFREYVLICGCIATFVGLTRFFFVWAEVEEKRARKELKEKKSEE